MQPPASGKFNRHRAEALAVQCACSVHHLLAGALDSSRITVGSAQPIHQRHFETDAASALSHAHRRLSQRATQRLPEETHLGVHAGRESGAYQRYW